MYYYTTTTIWVLNVRIYFIVILPKSPFTFHIRLIRLCLCYLTAVHNASPVTRTAENWELSEPSYHSMNSLRTKHKTLVSLVGRWYQGHPHSFVHIHSWLHFVWTPRCVHGLAYSLGNTIIYILWKSMPVCLLSYFQFRTLLSYAFRKLGSPCAMKIQWILLCHVREGLCFWTLNAVEEDSYEDGHVSPHFRIAFAYGTLLSIIALNFNGKIFFT